MALRICLTGFPSEEKRDVTRRLLKAGIDYSPHLDNSVSLVAEHHRRGRSMTTRIIESVPLLLCLSRYAHESTGVLLLLLLLWRWVVTGDASGGAGSKQ